MIAGEGYLQPFPSPNRQRQSAEGVTGKTAGPGRNPDGFSVDPGSLFSSTGLCVIPKQYGWAYCFRTGYRGSVALHLKSMGKLPATSVKTGSSIVTDYGSGKIDKTARSHQRQVSQPTMYQAVPGHSSKSGIRISRRGCESNSCRQTFSMHSIQLSVYQLVYGKPPSDGGKH